MAEPHVAEPHVAEPRVAEPSAPLYVDAGLVAFAPVARPYPGLRPFERHESEIFFGRERHTDRLLEILRRERFLSVTGPSGSGKSSLVRAGLLPMLSLGALGTGSAWRFATMRPGDRPLASLAAALLEPQALGGELRDASDGAPDYSAARVEAELRRGPLGLCDLVADARRHGVQSDDDAGLLLLVDQFEEIFTYADAGAREADEADAFVDLLIRTREQRDARVFIVLTMRTDFLGACVRFQNLPDLINESQYLTPRLTRDEMATAVAAPARMFGGGLDPDLVTELVNSVGRDVDRRDAGRQKRRAGGVVRAVDMDQLPVLQHALARMWDRALAEGRTPPQLHLRDLEGVGGTARALDRHADTVLAELSTEDQRAAELLFRAITEQRSAEAGGQTVRRPQSLERIAAWTGEPWERFLPVLARFTDPTVNFLTLAGPPGAPAGPATVIDISHESLMRQWGTLTRWIAGERLAAERFQELLRRARARARREDVLLQGVALRNARRLLRSGLHVGDGRSRDPRAAPTPAWAERYAPPDADASLTPFEEVWTFVGWSRWKQTATRGVIGVVLLIAAAFAAVRILDTVERWRRDAALALWEPWRGATFAATGDAGPDDPRWRAAVDLARASQRERRAFLDHAFEETTLAARLGDTLLLRAAVGLDPELRQHLLDRLGNAPAAGAGAVPPLPRVLATEWLGGRSTVEEILAAIDGTIDPDTLRALRPALYAASRVLDSAAAWSAWNAVTEQLDRTRDDDQRNALGKALDTIASRLSPIRARATAQTSFDTLFAHVAALAEGPSPPLATHLRAYQALAPRLGPAQATAQSQQIESLIRLSAVAGGAVRMNGALRAMRDSIDPGVVSAEVGRLTTAVVSSNQEFVPAPLVDALVALADRLSPAEAASEANGLVELIAQQRRYGVHDALAQALAATARALSPADAAAVGRDAATAIVQTSRAPVANALGPSMAVLAPRLSGEQAAAVARRLVREIGVADVGDALAALAARLDAAQAAALLPLFVAQLAVLPPYALSPLAEVVPPVVRPLDGAGALAALPPVLTQLAATRSASQAALVGHVLELLVERVDGPLPDPVVARLLSLLAEPVLEQKRGPAPRFGSPRMQSRLDGRASLAATRAAVVATALRLAAPHLNVSTRLNASMIATTLLDLVGRTTSEDSLYALGEGLNAVACCVYEAAANAITSALRSALARRPVGSAAGRDSVPGGKRGLTLTLTLGEKKSPEEPSADRRPTAPVVGSDQGGYGKSPAPRTSRPVDELRLNALVTGAAGLAPRELPTQVDRLVARYQQWIDSARTREQVGILGDGLVRMLRDLDSAAVEPALDPLNAALRAAPTGYVAFYSATAANVLLRRASLRGDRARDWIDACRHPLVDRAAVAVAVLRGTPAAAGPGEWPALAWGVQRFDLDPHAPLKAAVRH